MDMNGLGMSADAFNSLEIDQSWFAGGDNMDWVSCCNTLSHFCRMLTIMAALP